jgi:hypothetical protein
MARHGKVRQGAVRRAGPQRPGPTSQEIKVLEAIGFGGYMLVQVDINAAIVGGHPYAYSATLEDIEAFLASES